MVRRNAFAGITGLGADQWDVGVAHSNVFDEPKVRRQSDLTTTGTSTRQQYRQQHYLPSFS